MRTTLLRGAVTPPVAITSWGDYSAGSVASRMSINAIFTNSQGWRAANRVIYIPFSIPFDYTARQLYWANGSGVAGNVELSVMDINFKKLFSTGSVAASGTNQPQRVAMTTGASIAAGAYYWALACSSTSQDIEIISPNTTALQSTEIAGLLKESSDPVGFGVPSTGTPAAVLHADVPLVGMTNTLLAF